MAALYETQLEVLREMVEKAQQGDGRCRDELLAMYRPFIMKTASRYCRKYLREGKDEEISVAYLGFNEAIDSFQSEQGTGFLGFARLVMERRLADYYRRSSAWSKEIPFSGMQRESGDGKLMQIDKEAAETVYSEGEARFDRREEILYFTSLLRDYGITLGELVRISPKHSDARSRAVMAAKAVRENEEWMRYFLARKALPIKAMEEALPLSRKTLERQRKYIVALLLVYTEDLPYMREYLKGVSEA